VPGEDFEPDLCLVHATAVRWVADEPLPGVVEVQFSGHDGQFVTIHGKCSVIGMDLDAATSYPVSVCLPAEILAVSTPAAFVRLLGGVQDVTGRKDFTIGWSSIDEVQAPG
jgi:hypothetical protein